MVETSMRKSLYVHLYVIFLLCCATVSVSAEELKGKVIDINGDTVTVRLERKKIPVAGDPVTLILDHPELGEMTIGQWQVTKVHFPIVEAELVEATGEPEIGVRAVILSANPGLPAVGKPDLPGRKTVAADKALLNAVLNRSLARVKKALRDGAEINRPIKEGATILFAAVEQGDPEIIRYLLDNGADPAVEDNFGNTALIDVVALLARKEKQLEIIDLFQNAGISINKPTSTGMTLLHNAVRAGCDPEVIIHLINGGADIDSQLKISGKKINPKWQGYTPLMFAVNSLEEKPVLLLLAAGADQDLRSLEGKTAYDYLLEFEKSGNRFVGFKGKVWPLTDRERRAVSSLKSLLEQTEQARNAVRKKLREIFLDRIDANDIESVNNLINLGIALNGEADEASFLSHAVINGSNEMVMLLLNHGASPLGLPGLKIERENSTPLMSAIFNGNSALVKLFLEKGADPNDVPWETRGRGILQEYIKAKGDWLEMILTLIQGGSDPNWRDKDGNTPLHLAAKFGREIVFKALIRAGANPHIANRKRQEPIDLAKDTFLPGFDRRPIVRELQRKIETAYKEHNWQKVSGIAYQLIKRGEPSGYFFLGVMAERGNGRPVSYGDAGEYFRKGAEAGSVFCMYRLGSMFKEGKGVSQNGSRAAFWYEKAAGQGSISAQRELGILYLDGDGVEKRPELAFKLIKKAAVQGRGDRKALYYLAKLCEQGIGTPVNLTMAEKLYEEAKQKGYKAKASKKKSVYPGKLFYGKEIVQREKRTSSAGYPETPVAVLNAFVKAYQAGNFKKAARYIAPEERDELLKEFELYGEKVLKEVRKKHITITKIKADGDYAEAFFSITDGDITSNETQNLIKVEGKWYVTKKKILGKENVQKKLKNKLQWHKTETGKMVILGGEIFKPGQATLNPSAMRQIFEVLDLLNEQQGKILIVGHTDSSGSAGANLILSKKRAQVVGKQLILLGIDPGRLTITGHGEQFPVAGNDTREGRNKNRRVEIVLLDK